MKVIGIIQARMNSTRFPGKILAPIVDGQPLLSVLARRLATAGIEWWLATSNHLSDDVTAAWGEELGLAVFRGDAKDVLSRFIAIIRKTQPDWIVRVTADNPLTDGRIIQQLVAAAAEAPADIDVIRDSPRNRQFPLGYVQEIVRGSALLRIEAEIPDSQFYHRSHVTSFLPPERTAAYTDSQVPSRPNWRWTVDTLDDLNMVRAAFALLGPDRLDAGYAELVELLDRHPEIVAINEHIRAKALSDG